MVYCLYSLLAFYNHGADVPRLYRRRVPYSLSVEELRSPTETLWSKAPCAGCNRRSLIKLAYQALLRFKKNILSDAAESGRIYLSDNSAENGDFKMKKLALFGIIAAAAATVTAVVVAKRKRDDYCCENDIDEEIEYDGCCADCEECTEKAEENEQNEIPAEKADETCKCADNSQEEEPTGI